MKYITVLVLSLLLLACSDNDTSSGSGEVLSESGEVSSESGEATSSTVDSNLAKLTFSSKELTEGDTLTLNYDLGGSGGSAAKQKSKEGNTGTIRWGDNTQDRVRGKGTLTHRYTGDGTFGVSVQVDGGESVRKGNIVVSAHIAVAAGHPSTGTLDCTTPTGTLTLESSAGRVYVVSHTLGPVRVSVKVTSPLTLSIQLPCPATSSRLRILVDTLSLSYVSGSSEFVYDAN